MRKDADGLTRRLSARQAMIRRGRDGFEIEDVSRFGLLVDGACPCKHVPVLLREGMRIELTASIRGVVTLMVAALHPNAVVLHRGDYGAEAECFYLVRPDGYVGHRERPIEPKRLEAELTRRLGPPRTGNTKRIAG